MISRPFCSAPVKGLSRHILGRTKLTICLRPIMPRGLRYSTFPFDRLTFLRMDIVPITESQNR